MRRSVETADVVVIGGGVIGVTIAYYLAQRNVGRIVLLERGTLGSGGTGRSVASIDLFSFLPAAVELRASSHTVFTNATELLGESCGLVQTGFAMLAGPEQAEALRVAVHGVRAAGIEAHLLSPVEYALLEPAADVDDLSLICYVPAGGYADPILTLNAFASAARRADVVIKQGCSARGLRFEQGRVSGVETNDGPILAPVVVSAIGPWTQRLLGEVGLELGLQPVRHSVACLRRPANFGSPHPSFLDPVNQIYARPESGELTLVGSMEPTVGYDPAEPEEDHGRVSSDYTFWAVARLVRRYPSLETSEIRPGWSGMMMMSPDQQPLLGVLPELPGLYCATGFSGQGFQICPAVGDLMAGLIVGEAEATNRLKPFRPSRFTEGQPLQVSEFGVLG